MTIYDVTIKVDASINVEISVPEHLIESLRKFESWRRGSDFDDEMGRDLIFNKIEGVFNWEYDELKNNLSKKYDLRKIWSDAIWADYEKLTAEVGESDIIEVSDSEWLATNKVPFSCGFYFEVESNDDKIEKMSQELETAVQSMVFKAAVNDRDLGVSNLKASMKYEEGDNDPRSLVDRFRSV